MRRSTWYVQIFHLHLILEPVDLSSSIHEQTMLGYLNVKPPSCYCGVVQAKGDHDAADELWEVTHEYWGAQLYKFFRKHGGLWHKLGQYVSARADIFPAPFVKRLGKLQDELPQQKVDEIHKIIEKEMGKPVDSVRVAWMSGCDKTTDRIGHDLGICEQ